MSEMASHMPNAAFTPAIGSPEHFLAQIPALALAFEKRIGQPVVSLDDIRRDVLPRMTTPGNDEFVREAVAAFAAWTRDHDEFHWRLGGVFRKKIIAGTWWDAVELADYCYFQIVEGGRV
jgi:hypothetical protein